MPRAVAMGIAGRAGGAGGLAWLLPHLRGRVLARRTRRAIFEWGGGGDAAA